eukprot:gene32121-16640_t
MTGFHDALAYPSHDEEPHSGRRLTNSFGSAVSSCACCMKKAGPIREDTEDRARTISYILADVDDSTDNPDEVVTAAQRRAAREMLNSVSAGDLPKLKSLLKSTPSPLRSEVATELIVLAAQLGHADIIRILVDKHGASTEVYDDHRGGRPLMHAASNGHVAAVKTLLALGADTEALDFSGCTALIISVFSDRCSAAECLLHQGNAHCAGLPTPVGGHGASLAGALSPPAGDRARWTLLVVSGAVAAALPGSALFIGRLPPPPPRAAGAPAGAGMGGGAPGRLRGGRARRPVGGPAAPRGRYVSRALAASGLAAAVRPSRRRRFRGPAPRGRARLVCGPRRQRAPAPRGLAGPRGGAARVAGPSAGVGRGAARLAGRSAGAVSSAAFRRLVGVGGGAFGRAAPRARPVWAGRAAWGGPAKRGGKRLPGRRLVGTECCPSYAKAPPTPPTPASPAAAVDLPNPRGRQRRTALSHAVEYGSLDCIHVLCNAGADVWHIDKNAMDLCLA